MNAFWSYFWPILAGGFVLGAISATLGFRRSRLKTALVIGAAAALGLAALWHGPMGAADRFSARVDAGLRKTFVFYEIPQVSGHLHRNPLSRHVLLSGPADNFQRSELVRITDQVPGVSSASWTGGRGVPLIAEAGVAALLGFLFGLLLAYLVELRRRYNAQWNW